MSKVIYTAIIGGYDTLVEPDYKLKVGILFVLQIEI